MSKIVTFNLQGTRFEVSKNIIDEYINEASLLKMLTRNNPDDKEILIEKDHKMFRWILYVERENKMVSHEVVRVSKEIWEDELQYYGININCKEKTTLNEQEQSLIDICQKHVKQREKKKQEEEEILKQMFLGILKHAVENMGTFSYCILKFSQGHEYSFYDTISYTFAQIKRHASEFEKYARTLGFYVDTYDTVHDKMMFKIQFDYR